MGLRTGKCFLIVLALASAAWAQDDPVIEVVVPDDIDPNAGSGWIRVELAVLVDDRPETLQSETWPAYPEARYPLKHRRLKDDQLAAALAERYPETQVIAGDEGLITLLIPDPEQWLADATAEALVIDADGEAVTREESTEDAAAIESPAPEEPLASSDEPTTAAPPLEMINAPGAATGVGADWLSEFAEPLAPAGTTPETQIPLIDNSGASTDDVLPAPEPALPLAFTVRTPSLLAEGLSRMTSRNPDRLQLSTAWLQPPDAANLPIILDNSGDEGLWPPLQGFMELRTGDTLRMGINFWWNTDASYLPPGFHMEAPPAAPPQLLWRDLELSTPLTTEEATQRQETFKAIADHQQAGLPLIEFVDPNTGFFREEEAESREQTGLPPEDPWPWHHFLHVTDTRVVPEGYIRYFDHPVLKVVATWRELTWGEVYQIGAADRERLDIEAAVEAALQAEGPKVDPPVAQLPPDQDLRR